MSASAWSVALLGADGVLVEVEAALGAGLPRTVLVGLPDTALYEARDRCRAAVAGAGLAWPAQLLTINLTPASLPKSGSHYDLAIVAAVLACSKIVPSQIAASSVLLGELGLDGRVRRVNGVLPALIAARKAGFERAIVPAEQLAEAELVSGMTVWGASTLADLVEIMHGRPGAARISPSEQQPEPELGCKDLSDVRGQSEAVQALIVAAAGGHHLLLHGAPGVGKTMLAERLPGLLPQLGVEESLEVSAVHSLVGHDLNRGLITRPPYSAPHHNATVSSLIGGGPKIARPGAISLAHRGVLFLDEAAEFSPQCLDALRTPLESGQVTIARSQGMVRFPARFQLVMATNPCPCGRYGSTSGRPCSCAPFAIRRYQQRLSGPIVDRMDIQVHMEGELRGLGAHELESAPATETVAQQVLEARDRQKRRWQDAQWCTNCEVPGPQLRKMALPQGMGLLEAGLARGEISARGVDKVLRVAWTVADLAGHDVPTKQDLMIAYAMRRCEQAVAA